MLLKKSLLKNSIKNIFQIRKLKKNDRVAYCLVSAVLLAFPIAVLIIMKTPLGHFFGCAFLKITGKPCMFCGMTRSLEFCFKFDYNQALQWHLFGPLFFAGYVLLLLKYLTGFIFSYTIDIKITKPKTRNMFFYVIGGVVFIYWILRLFNFSYCSFPG